MSEAHSILSPSSAGYWAPVEGCPGYPRMAQLHPDVTDNTAADEGTIAHDYAESLIHGSEYVGDGVTEEIIESATVYADDARLTVHSPEVTEWGTEQRLSMPRIHPEMFGTPDLWAWFVTGKKIIVWDFKHGRGSVDAFENWQGVSYFAGLVDRFPGAEVFEVRIVQPRAFSPGQGTIRVWTATAVEMGAYFERLKTAAAEAMSPTPMLRTGSQCRYCSARHACPALRDLTMWSLDTLHSPTAENPSTAEMVSELEELRIASKAIEYRLSGVEAQIEHKINSGQNVPGWKMQSKAGNKVWIKPIDQVLMIGKLNGLDLSKPGAITPTQAEKAGLSVDVTKVFADRKQGKAKLVKVNQSEVAKIFKEQ